MTTALLCSRLCLHIMAAAGLIHQQQPITLEIEDLNTTVIILEHSFLGRQLPIRIAACRLDFLACLTQGFEFTLEAFDLTSERSMFRQPHECDPRRSFS